MPFALFLSHGAPDVVLTEAPAKRFLSDLAAHLTERPRAILVASAHWETREPAVTAAPVNATLHDFGGFDPRLYDLRYPAPGDPALAERVSDLLAAAGLPCALDGARGLDHGAWIPLMLAFPGADLPVLQISLQGHLGPAHHFALGEALRPLTEEGVLVIGSGSLTHDLAGYLPHRHTPQAPETASARAFADWFDARLVEGALAEAIAYRRLAPDAARHHPTEEHLLPLFVAWGAGGGPASRLHASAMHAVLRMDAYAFGAPGKVC